MHEMLHRMTGKGLSAHYQFSRQPCIFGDRMVSVQVTLTNTSDQKIENIHIGEKKLPPGMRMHEFNPIGNCILYFKILLFCQISNIGSDGFAYSYIFLHIHTSPYSHLSQSSHPPVCIDVCHKRFESRKW